MPPRKQTPEEQQEELRATLENFTTTLRETLLQAVETALTTVVQRQQQVNADNQPREEDDTDEDLPENLFAEAEPRNNRNQVRNVAPAEHQLNRREHQPEERRWDMGFRVEIPEFNGNLNTEEFLDWLSSIEEILEYKRVPGDQCVPLIASRFKNRAMAWWQQIKESRRRAGKPRIETWERLKNICAGHFYRTTTSAPSIINSKLSVKDLVQWTNTQQNFFLWLLGQLSQRRRNSLSPVS